MLPRGEAYPSAVLGGHRAPAVASVGDGAANWDISMRAWSQATAIAEGRVAGSAAIGSRMTAGFWRGPS